MEYRKAFEIINGKEIEIPFKDIKKGMKIRLYDSYDNVFTTLTDAYKNENGKYVFDINE